MQQWEYTTVQSSRDRVIKIGGQRVGTNSIFYSEGKSLHETLNSLGSLGWEMVSLLPRDEMGKVDERIDLLVFLKRPIVSDSAHQTA